MHANYDLRSPYLSSHEAVREPSANAEGRRPRLGAEPTVCSIMTRAVLDEVEHRGFSGATLAASVGLEESEIRDAEARINLKQHVLLFSRAAGQADDPLFPVAVGRRLPDSAFHVVAHAAALADTLGGALELFSRYWLVFAEGLSFDVERGIHGDAMVISVSDARVPSARNTLIALTSYMLSFAERVSGRRLRVRCISFPFSAPSRTSELAVALGTPLLTFDGTQLRIDLDAGQLDTRLRNANAPLRTELEELATRALNRAAPSVIVARTRASIARLHGQSTISIDTVAKDLGMSSRTLQRHLKYAAATFSGLRDAVCGDIAKELLRDRSRTVDEVGTQLGFSSRSAFHRAFLRWTGKTPAEYRSAA